MNENEKKQKAQLFFLFGEAEESKLYIQSYQVANLAMEFVKTVTGSRPTFDELTSALQARALQIMLLDSMLATALEREVDVAASAFPCVACAEENACRAMSVLTAEQTSVIALSQAYILKCATMAFGGVYTDDGMAALYEAALEAVK